MILPRWNRYCGDACQNCLPRNCFHCTRLTQEKVSKKNFKIFWQQNPRKFVFPKCSWRSKKLRPNTLIGYTRTLARFQFHLELQKWAKIWALKLKHFVELAQKQIFQADSSFFSCFSVAFHLLLSQFSIKGFSKAFLVGVSKQALNMIARKWQKSFTKFILTDQSQGPRKSIKKSV